MLRLFLIGLGISLAYFAITWAISVKMRNYGFLDVAWSYGVAILAPIYALAGPGETVRKWTLTAVGMAWSARLGTYIFLRVLRHHPKEDGRYQTLRKRWSGPGMFFVFFELQAVLAAIFSLPFLIVSFDSSPDIKPLSILGLVLAALALCGEAISDFQMQNFKSDPGNKDKVCETGLWYYSRHPNYFFESLIWWAFFLVAIGSPLGWITIVCPLLMLYFLFKVTGIPLTEEHAVQSKGDLYRDYQRTTSAFVPWFRKTI